MNASSLHQFGWYLRNVLLSEAGPDLLKPALRALVLERALGAPADKQDERDGSDPASGTDKADIGHRRFRAVLRRMTAYAAPPVPCLEPFEQKASFGHD